MCTHVYNDKSSKRNELAKNTQTIKLFSIYCAYDFCHMSAVGVKTFARLSTPQSAGLIKRAGGNLVSGFRGDKESAICKEED